MEINSKIELIAEIGWNSMGNINLAEDMIAAAKYSGADYAKFQTWKVDNLKPGPWDTDGRREIYEKAELSEEDHYLLKDICDKYKIKFLTSCFNLSDLDFIRKLSSEVKIPGVECRNKELVDKAIEKFDRVFLSTGTTALKEVPNVQSDKVVLMHCVSCYPCPPELVNMTRMIKMKELFDCPIGYGGHYQGIWDAVLAVQNGAKVIEKHFTTDNSLPGRDNKFALLPEDFVKIREFANESERMMSLNSYDYLPQEQEARDVYTGRWSG